MKRFFYTDPLAAAFMAKHFGMLFDAPVKPVFNWGGMPAMQFVPDRFVIHPGSLHLLDVQDGDVLIGTCGGELYRAREMPDFDGECSLDFARDLVVNTAFQIIQRDGTPFIFPDCEAE